MPQQQEDEPKILLDADVVIHFIKAGYQLKLIAIFPNRFVMLDKVKAELLKRKSESLGIENFLSWCKIPVEAMPKDIEILREYAHLKKLRGDGESACMAVARFRNEYIASSNISDIKAYCTTHSIKYYTTMDLLVAALENAIMTEEECNGFIKEVKAKGSKLPTNTIAEYKKLKKYS